jgi:hypothetical protein
MQKLSQVMRLHSGFFTINEEIESLHKNQTWELVKFPKGA